MQDRVNVSLLAVETDRLSIVPILSPDFSEDREDQHARHIVLLETSRHERFGERATERESPRKPIARREIEVSHRYVRFRASEQRLCSLARDTRTAVFSQIL